jgi:2-polyprenyl-3-methyl-5-hydroxy-6-metoxy-1,4-benzoquinol methylase
VRELLNYTMLFAMFNVLHNEGEFFEISDPVVEKYLACLSVIDAPYFVRYVFKVNLLRWPKIFKKYKDALTKDGIDLVYGNTGQQRLEAVTSRLSKKNHIIDVGCGEGNFVFHIAKHLPPPLHYYAIDIREEARDRVRHKSKLKQLDNVTVLESFQHFLDHDPQPAQPHNCDALLVEVIEHMELDEAAMLVQSVLSVPTIQTVIITTPNKDFNQFYDFTDEELRHDDHKFEFTAKEFEEWITKAVPRDFTVKLFDIGDKVNGHATTLGACIRRVQVIDDAVFTHTAVTETGVEMGGFIKTDRKV